MNQITASWLAQRLPGARSADVHSGVATLINTGDLPPGAQLPTIRELAAELGVKVSAITDAWTLLREDGLLETRRRGGTRVRSYPDSPAHQAGTFTDWSDIELIHAWPDAALLPDISADFAAAVDPARPPAATVALPAALQSRLAASWPWAAAEFATSPTTHEAFQLTVGAAIADRARLVAVESPGLLRTPGALTSLAAQPIILDSDAEGPTATSLTQAIERGARVIVVQPTARVPTSSSLSVARRHQLAEILRGTDTWIVEDDTVGPLFSGESLGEDLPEQTVRITQYWRAYGPDLGIAAIGGAPALLEKIRTRQRIEGPRTTRHQHEVLSRLLADRSTSAMALAAGRRYLERGDRLVQALRDHGVDTPRGGLYVWVPVHDEARTTADLASVGVRVLGGASSYISGTNTPHLRIAVTQLPDDPHLVSELASLIAQAASGQFFADSE